MAEQETKMMAPTGLIKNNWVASSVSLIVGIGLGTTVGPNVLDTAGVPPSFVRAIQRADTALATGTAVANNGESALDAVKGLQFAQAGDLLGQAKDDAATFFGQAKAFNHSRQRREADRG